MKKEMSDFRCENCHQLQHKFKLNGDKLEIEIKCYACNRFNYFTVWLNEDGRLEVSIKKEKNV